MKLPRGKTEREKSILWNERIDVAIRAVYELSLYDDGEEMAEKIMAELEKWKDKE